MCYLKALLNSLRRCNIYLPILKCPVQALPAAVASVHDIAAKKKPQDHIFNSVFNFFAPKAVHRRHFHSSVK